MSEAGYGGIFWRAYLAGGVNKLWLTSTYFVEAIELVVLRVLQYAISANAGTMGKDVSANARVVDRDGDVESMAGKCACFPGVFQVYGRCQLIFVRKSLGFGDS